MLEAAVAAARRAGRIQRERLGGAFQIRHKGVVDLVTEVDLACEEAIRAELTRRWPGTAVLGEEAGAAGTGPDRWIVDPLDGTTNYAHGYPAFCTSIAWEEAGSIAVAVVYDPVRDELFTARVGRGAFLNGEAIRVSTTPKLLGAILATGFPYDRREHPRNYDEFRHLTQVTQGVRRSGSAALDLAYMAAGRLDGFWEPCLAPWDLAAGILLVAEAGGRVTDFHGRPFTPYDRDVAASNGRIHRELLEALTLPSPVGT